MDEKKNTLKEKIDSGDLKKTLTACKSSKTLGDFRAKIDSGDLKKK